MNASGSARGSRGEDEDVVVRKVDNGWVVGDEEVSDLTSAMVLADLFAADQNHAQPAYSDGRTAGAWRSRHPSRTWPVPLRTAECFGYTDAPVRSEQAIRGG